MHLTYQYQRIQLKIRLPFINMLFLKKFLGMICTVKSLNKSTNVKFLAPREWLKDNESEIPNLLIF